MSSFSSILSSIPFLKLEFYFIPTLSVIGAIAWPPALTLILLVFAFVPAIYPTPKFFKKMGFENVIIEYQYLKKIIYISIVVLITLIGYYLYLVDVTSKVIQQDESLRKLQAKVVLYIKKFQPQIEELQRRGGSATEIGIHTDDILKEDKQGYNLLLEFGSEIASKFFLLIISSSLVYQLLIMIPVVPVSITIKLLLAHARREFRLYYAKGCFKIVSKEGTHELDKAKYFKTGLIWYNKFLKKNIGLHITDIMKIYSKIITQSPLDQNRALISISESFDSEDAMKPLRYISAFIPDTEMGQALTKESITTTIKGSSDLLIPIITIIITIITTFILPKPR